MQVFSNGIKGWRCVTSCNSPGNFGIQVRILKYVVIKFDMLALRQEHLYYLDKV